MRLVPVLLLLATAAGCASTTVSVDRDETVDFSALRTFGWRPDPTPEGERERPASLFDRRARREVERRLTERGYRRADSPDLLLDVSLRTREVREVTSWDHGRYWRRHGFVTVRDRIAAAVVLDVVDTRRNAVVWRGATPIALGPTGPGAEDVASAVEALLEQFPAGR